MRLGCLFQIAVLVTAIAAGLCGFSFWWTVIPAFFAGALQISNGPGFDLVENANRQGRLGVFPALLALNLLPWLAVAGVGYWIATYFSN